MTSFITRPASDATAARSRRARESIGPARLTLGLGGSCHRRNPSGFLPSFGWHRRPKQTPLTASANRGAPTRAGGGFVPAWAPGQTRERLTLGEGFAFTLRELRKQFSWGWWRRFHLRGTAPLLLSGNATRSTPPRRTIKPRGADAVFGGPSYSIECASDLATARRWSVRPLGGMTSYGGPR